MRSGSLFSGIAGIELGLARAGIETAWFCEYDKAARSVLARHFPGTPIYEDVTTLDPASVEPVDILTGGFPCQDLSVAGRRKGLAGERSGLFHEFMRLAAALSPDWLLIENVPGLLSSNEGRDMGIVLGTLGELGYGWAYRVLDAQYFGVAQRRRRVFIVGCLGDARRAAQVLFEPESCGGNPAPSREPGARFAGAVAACLNSGGNNGGFRTEPGEHLVAEPFRKATTLHSADANDERWEEAQTTNTLAGHGATTREAIVMAPGFSKRPGQQIATRQDGLSYAVTTGEPRRVFPTLRGFGHGWQGQHNDDATKAGMVRRLTPTECERLQGFPDGWTEGQPDSTRYRQLGNAVCVNVAEWIAKRIAAQLRVDEP